MDTEIGEKAGRASTNEPNGQAAGGGATQHSETEQPSSASRSGGNHNASNGRPDDYTTDERNAMRSFLQRSEVRISTIHRVAVGFLSGAGLLFLFPVFLKDGVLTLITALLDYVPSIPAALESLGIVGVILLYICLLFPFLLSLGLPVVALLLLLEDIVRFYFVGHPPTFSEEFFNPRFVLTGVAFSPDESPTVKDQVMRYEYGTDLISFVVSRTEAHSRYYSNIIDKPHRYIVPSTRKLPRLIKAGVVKLDEEKPLDQLSDDDTVTVQYTNGAGNSSNGNGNNSNGNNSNGYGDTTPYVHRTVDEIDRFNAALGLTGFIERPLYQEVAKTEVSLVRHSLKLRRLVLRYVQALLILIWTSFITFLMLPFLRDSTDRFPLPIVFAVAYLIWALLAPWIVQLPLEWLVGHPHTEVRRTAIKRFQQLDALQTFGKQTQRLCYVAVAASVVALLFEIVFRV